MSEKTNEIRQEQAKVCTQQQESADAPEEDWFGNDQMFDDDMFNVVPDGTRIFISGNSVTFENMTTDMAEVAQALNPDDKTAKRATGQKRKGRKKS